MNKRRNENRVWKIFLNYWKLTTKLVQSVSVQMVSICWRRPWTERRNYGLWRMDAAYRRWTVTQTTSSVARSRTTATLSSQRAKIILARFGDDSIGFRCVLSFCLLFCSSLTLYTSMQFKRSCFKRSEIEIFLFKFLFTFCKSLSTKVIVHVHQDIKLLSVIKVF